MYFDHNPADLGDGDIDLPDGSVSAMTGFNEAEGHAASLRQQAAWIEESPAAEMIDADELRAAANFIERLSRSSDRTTAPIRNDMRALFHHVDDQDWEYLLSRIGDGGRDRFWKTVIADIRGALAFRVTEPWRAS